MSLCWPEQIVPFSRRHNGPSPADQQEMLQILGLKNLDELVDQVVPQSIRPSIKGASIGPGVSEADAIERLRRMARKNRPMTSMIGQGYYDTFMPSVVMRNVLENPAWYTAYTPYQPEISQGRLEALLNFQTLVSDLTGMPVANASLLDDATACAEAMAMAYRVGKKRSNRFLVDQDIHPQVLSVMQTRARPQGWEIEVASLEGGIPERPFFGALLSYPGSSGEVRDPRAWIDALHQQEAIVTLLCDPMALVLLESPQALGADIAVGSMQRYGMPLGNGGPHAAFMATKDAYKRSIPGRIVGVSRDRAGKPALRLALQTREQHIRREKATSNICTAQALPAMLSGFYALYHGPEGLQAIATRIHRFTSILAAGFKVLGITRGNTHFFDTITLELSTQAEAFLDKARQAGINLRDMGAGRVGISCDETTQVETIRALWRCAGADDARLADFEKELSVGDEGLPAPLCRQGDFLTHPIFHRYHSETDMMRYMRRLADKDLALDRSMIPLGSCTMKLNPATAMMPITWPEFGRIHPFAPEDQKQGYSELYAYLEKALCTLSGYDAVSLQPNSGAQGEFAGLMAIAAYHRAHGQGQRHVCLIPASAHGTNPASAQMAGMTVVVVACDDAGNVDVADLKAKLAQYEGEVAAVMVTYPSTHGVFEERITEICALVHEAGGQVYLDGANLNAQVGLARPGKYGADVSHFNLHKTFCVPHGGGGPGMGPIGVGAHLAPYLPTGEADGARISAAPYGSASVLPISAAYIMMMGDEGLRQASIVAVLNANYIAKRLEGAYEVLFRGERGFTAHECILDLRPLKEKAGVTVDDITKRLIDYGFHAPTVSFPVPGTVMIEPTESESRWELDRFCQAMLSIREEIALIETGERSYEETPLSYAPHTAADLTSEWPRRYSRYEGVYPAGTEIDKYWPAVGRIDNVWGDRNLICSCPDIASYVSDTQN
ncbi:MULTISPECIES: aminomethyl-transferring glycine dehydrogenase [unclassified Saccharibacter]|uniref:aminomethyl-transferring glycine dehydrogenase n=1 Tax=unclassified Saccharibacter TaxID=2648722 RepID=UPI00132B9341|nr:MULTISPECIES: aminomethyl-transferring glycine dehydrogenase [unclassified Saccharibacter]MXV36382.1 aminomethyl-transferring glycine dehydrogenase [Saccharibacter sp. EH611]MXV57544.1 aminomethyl-transferring glycine dehydrogenase [Saccharibacter sp. EH70]MXV65149.1 aminomethyl-transferring glycine dehydrogenase [Saccharibacter sp. EH60]